METGHKLDLGEKIVSPPPKKSLEDQENQCPGPRKVPRWMEAVLRMSCAVKEEARV